MKKEVLISAVVFVLLMLCFQSVSAVNIGASVGIEMQTEQFKPLIWMCQYRIVYDDNIERGRPEGGNELEERINNYAFTGEQITWEVLVMDKNGIEKVKDVYVAVGAQGSEQYIEANCQLNNDRSYIMGCCNARIGEEKLEKGDWDPKLMAYYKCTFTVEPQMHGEYWMHAVVTDLDDQSTAVDEDEYWFFNPEIQLKITGDIDFGKVRPGTTAYSPTIAVQNGAEAGSGVLLDMFISGTDFYDPSHSGAKCPITNQLKLGDGDRDCDDSDPFCYYAVNGAYSTREDWDCDSEGYVGIRYGDHFDSTFYDHNEIIRSDDPLPIYYLANILAPEAEMSITFRLNLPEPCNGDFTDGNIFFWAEAI